MAEMLRTLEVTINRRLDGVLHGNHQGLTPGHGTEPGEARLYQPGDDVRRIDWNVTARTQHTHIRELIADRDLEAWLVVDASAAMRFGTEHNQKAQIALAAAGSGRLPDGPQPEPPRRDPRRRARSAHRPAARWAHAGPGDPGEDRRAVAVGGARAGRPRRCDRPGRRAVEAARLRRRDRRLRRIGVGRPAGPPRAAPRPAGDLGVGPTRARHPPDRPRRDGRPGDRRWRGKCASRLRFSAASPSSRRNAPTNDGTACGAPDVS